MSRARIPLLAVVACVGMGAQVAGPFWGRPLLWLPDLAVGLALVGAGLLTWDRSRGTSWLVGLAGMAWYAGSLTAYAHFWHRGFVIHALLAYPGARPRSRVTIIAIVVGYATALVPDVWRDPRAVAVLATALVGVVLWRRAEVVQEAGRLRRQVRVALMASAAYGIVVVTGEVMRAAVPGHRAVVPMLIAYEVALVGIAALLVAGLRAPPVARVADLVVELGDGEAGLLQDALSRTLGDPSLQLARWDEHVGAYVDDRGGVVSAEANALRAITHVEQDGRPLAILVHDPAVLDDPALVQAVEVATRLAADHAALEAEVQAQVEAVAASRRRLLLTADRERQRLEVELREGVGQRLESLSGLVTDDLATARGRLVRARRELHEVARGLRPHELDQGGLPAALTALAAHSVVPVAVSVAPDRFAPEVETAAYYVCAEALTNVVKHSGGTGARITAAPTDGVLVVVIEDDGVGGADAAAGTGLQGLADRVDSLGGALLVDSPAGGGTRLTATIPAT